MIGLEWGITYDDEAHKQWAVCLESQLIHINHGVHCVSYLKDVLVLGLWLLISWSWMNHLSVQHTSLSNHKLNQAALKASSSMEDVFYNSRALGGKTSIYVVSTSAYQITFSVCGIFPGSYKARQTLCDLFILYVSWTRITCFNLSMCTKMYHFCVQMFNWPVTMWVVTSVEKYNQLLLNTWMSTLFTNYWTAKLICSIS